MMDQPIRFFKDINKNDLAIVGGKAANLGELTWAGIPVPDGFCVTTAVFKDFIEGNELGHKIDKLLEETNQTSVVEIGPRIRQLIEVAAVPPYLEAAMARALEMLGRDENLAIRSSATAEDLSYASFAGQQESYLNIRGLKDVLTHIRKCWASLYTDRAILYRLQNGIDHEGVAMAVVVQKMVLAEFSGIMFTADPVTGNRHLVSIDAGFGLGEAMVSGLVSPDIYKVDRRTNQVVEAIIPYKQSAIRPLKTGGTELVTLTKDEGEVQVLDQASILGLAAMADVIEDHYGAPQDIEWCIKDGHIYVVQSRAITSLYPIPTPLPEDGSLHVYISANHLQSMLKTISPFGLDLMPLIFRQTKVALMAYQSKGMIRAGGRFYIDMTAIVRTNLGQKKVIPAMKNGEVLIAKGLEKFVREHGTRGKSFRPSKTLLHMMCLLKKLPFGLFKVFLVKDTRTLVTSADEACDKIQSKAEAAIHASQGGRQRLEVIYDSMQVVKPLIDDIMPSLLAGMISMKLLEKIAIRNFGSRDRLVEMTKGLKGNVTTEMGLLLGDLADEVRQSQVLQTVFKDEDYLDLFNRLDQLPGHESFKELFKTFFDHYGCRANGEIDIASTRWRENPEQIARSIMSMVEGMSHQQHRKEFAKTRRVAQKACGDFVRDYRAKNGRIKSLAVKRLVKVMRQGLPIREHHKFMLMGIYDVVKVALLKDAQELVAAGCLETSQDIFWLGYKELYATYHHKQSQVDLIKARKETYRHFDQLQPPRVISSDGEIFHGSYDIKDYPKDAMIGIAASTGVVEGIAKVVSDPAKVTLAKGEILVAPFTDPSWTPLFLNAAGLVMEVGGQLTHGTVVAREYGLPAVVGVASATGQIASGDRIRVDGNAGFVVILEKRTTR